MPVLSMHPIPEHTHTHSCERGAETASFPPLRGSAAAIRHPFTDRNILLMRVRGQLPGGEPEPSPWQPATQWRVQRKPNYSRIP